MVDGGGGGDCGGGDERRTTYYYEYPRDVDRNPSVSPNSRTPVVVVCYVSRVACMATSRISSRPRPTDHAVRGDPPVWSSAVMMSIGELYVHQVLPLHSRPSRVRDDTLRMYGASVDAFESA